MSGSVSSPGRSAGTPISFTSSLKAWFEGHSQAIELAASYPVSAPAWLRIETARVAVAAGLRTQFIYTNGPQADTAQLATDFAGCTGDEVELHALGYPPLDASEGWLIRNANEALMRLYHTRRQISYEQGLSRKVATVTHKSYAIFLPRPLEEDFYSQLARMNMKISEGTSNDVFVLNFVSVPTST